MPIIRLFSTGRKTPGFPPPADLYLDCRVITNPYRDPRFDGKTGTAQEVQEFVSRTSPEVLESFHLLVRKGLETLSSRRIGDSEAERPFKVCCFCAYGVHRSVAVKWILAKDLGYAGFDVEVE